MAIIKTIFFLPFFFSKKYVKHRFYLLSLLIELSENYQNLVPKAIRFKFFEKFPPHELERIHENRTFLGFILCQFCVFSLKAYLKQSSPQSSFVQMCAEYASLPSSVMADHVAHNLTIAAKLYTGQDYSNIIFEEKLNRKIHTLDEYLDLNENFYGDFVGVLIQTRTYNKLVDLGLEF